MAEWWELGEDPASPARPDPKASAALTAPPPAALAKPPSREDLIRDVETELHAEAVEVMRGVARFADFSDEELGADGPPPWLVAQHNGDHRAAARSFRIAKASASNSKDAPIGLKLCKDIMVGMAKVRAKEKAPAKTLNLVVVQMTGQLPKFDSIEVEPQRD